ncbi:hypothetical protein GALL_500550 [mine drainage metagenome]|uniref:Uncharacterized protein n=1 Tax=mine drainage metagenome TaxID=410659 RepID=A0A1J5P9S8_9ZZZZ
MAGSTIAYTHGWPNIQNRCCQSSALPPPVASKKCVPNCLSIHSMRKARLTAGTASRLPTEAVSVPHTRIGTRLMDMPGARVRNNVTMKLIEPTVVETPSSIMPSA